MFTKMLLWATPPPPSSMFLHPLPQVIDNLTSRVRALEDLVTKKSGGKEGDFKLHVASKEAMEAVQERLTDQREDMDRIKTDMGELMHVYDDMQVPFKDFQPFAHFFSVT